MLLNHTLEKLAHNNLITLGNQCYQELTNTKG